MKQTHSVEKYKPVIIMKGDPKCVHHERIVGLVGTCINCGQIRRYHDFNQFSEDKFNPAVYAKGEDHRNMFVNLWLDR
jgi:hypothetical protein